MAAISPPHSGRSLAEGTDGRTWGHKKNSSSQDSRQNFSYPNAYSESPPPQSPHSPDEFTTPSSAFQVHDAGASQYAFDDSPHTPEEQIMSDQAVNRINNPRTRYNGDTSVGNNYGDGMSSKPRQQKGPLYGATSGAKRDKPSGQSNRSDPEYDNSQWIHSDKLTMIEIQEHIALGKKVPPELLEKANARQQMEQNRSYRPGLSYDNHEERYVDNKRQRVASPSPEASYEEDDEPFVPEDPRSPEEIAAEVGHPPAIYQQNRLRSSSSRIPLSTTSPLPVPQEHLDRNRALQRKRGGSGTFDEGQIAYPKSRSRSNSVGSQILLDDEAYMGPNTPGSPSKARTPSKAGPAGRKGSSSIRASSASKARNASSLRNSPAARPTTRDGRPTTATNRPEGDPPWLSQMYKPDPRLPPDQQMLPTHAKRMMQEQWEKEGRPGQAYDRDFRPIVPYPDDEHLRPQNATTTPELQPANAEQGTWPQREKTPEPQHPQLSPQITQTSQRGQQSPTRAHQNAQQSNGEVHGGYSTIPKVQGTPVLGGASPRPDNNRDPFDMVEEPGQAEKGSKKSGCGCCIIM